MNEKAFDEAVERIGGPARLGDLLGESPQTIVNWRARGSVPANKCKAFEAATGVSVKLLRDDWAAYWPELQAA